MRFGRGRRGAADRREQRSPAEDPRDAARTIGHRAGIGFLCLSLAACAQPHRADSSTASSPVAATTDISVPATADSGHLASVRVARHDGYDRMVLEFTDRVPGYTIGYRPLPAHQDASGFEIPLPGAKAAVLIQLTPATAYGWAGTERTYFGPATVTGDSEILTEAKEAGDFEAVLSWVAGLRSQVPFRATALADPPRLVIDFIGPSSAGVDEPK